MAALGATPTYGPGGRCFCVVCADEAARRVLERKPPRSPGHTPFRTKHSPSNPRELFDYVDHTSPKATPLSPKFTPMSLTQSNTHHSPSSRLATGSPIREDRDTRVHFAPVTPTRIRPPVDETEPDEEYGLINTHGSFLSDGTTSSGATMTLHLGSAHHQHHDFQPVQLDPSTLFKPPDDTELLLREWNRRREEGVTEALRTNVKSLEESLRQLHGEAQQKLAYVNKAAQRDAARLAIQQEKHRQEQDRKTVIALQSMRQGHDQQLLDNESKLRNIKEKRDAQERARLQEEAIRRAQEEERRRKEAEAEMQRQAEQKKKDEEAAQRSRDAATAALASASAAASASLRASGGGATGLAAGGSLAAVVGAGEPENASARRQLRFEQADVALKELADLQNQIKALPQDAMRARADMDRKIILNLNQVVATQEKCHAVIGSILGVLTDASRINPTLLLHCINTFTARLVQKGQGVAAQPSSAYPYAYVAVGVCQKCPQLVKYLRAAFFKTCPYTIPRYIRRQGGWTDAQFLSAQGYEPNEESPNGFEPEDEYRLRMGGTVMLWAAVLQTDEVFRSAHPYGIGEAWVWIAALGNMKPRRFTALFLHDFLKVAGLRLSEVYPQQFRKYIFYIFHDFINRLPAQTTPADKSRLSQLAEAYMSHAADWSGVGRRLDPH